MTWNVDVTGYASAVLATAEQQLKNQSTGNVVESIVLDHIGSVIRLALKFAPDDLVVKVRGYGSENSDGKGKSFDQVHLDIEPIYGFVPKK